MANYLPVLLVSVTNTVPDDSFVNTQPRAQVDYLSHEWQEEDVWRSWRNMTRQKNEIANGVRLENASWRTWWKQRNKLKTVTPETLNWLKDSDVTWLYGPLHTAADSNPRPKPLTDTSFPSSNDRNDPSKRSQPTTKPILKYRSISELLTSDLPNSPIFSPAESEDEEIQPSMHESQDVAFGSAQSSSLPKRPTLLHTKSDTHITRWGPNRAFRKDSPPRIDPPGHEDNQSYFPKVTATGPVRSSISQDSNSSAGNSTNGEKNQKKKHISFNTFVEQCIAIEKPKRSTSFYGYGGRFRDDHKYYDDDDGYEEDKEDSASDEIVVGAPWTPQRIQGGSDSDSPYDDEEEEGVIEMRSSYRDTPKKKTPRSQSKVSNASTSSTASSTTNSTTNSSSPSRDGHNSSVSSVSTAKRRPSRRSSTSTYRPRPPLGHATTEHVHVTIAPIAPTVLKTTEVWEEGFGDEVVSDDGLAWRERMWAYDNGKGKSKPRGREGSDTGAPPVELVYVPPYNSRYPYGYEEMDLEEEEDVAAEIFANDDYEEELDEGLVHTPRYRRNSTGDIRPSVFHHRGTVVGSVGFEDFSDSVDKPGSVSPPNVAASSTPIPIPSHVVPEGVPTEEDRARMGFVGPTSQAGAVGVPKLVVVEQGTDANVQDEDEFDFFDGPDLGEEYIEVTPGPSRGRSYGTRTRGKERDVEERPSRSSSRTESGTARLRSRSKSHSRTPSPALMESAGVSSSLGDGAVQAPVASVSASSTSSSRPVLRRASSSVSPSSSVLLSPPTRGRSYQDLAQGVFKGQDMSGSQGRGRSSTRTPPVSTSFESSTSPFGSLSPDAGSRYGERYDRNDRDSRRGREGGRDRERGRDRTTEKRLSVSLSSSPEPLRNGPDGRDTRSRESASIESSLDASAKNLVPPPAREQEVRVGLEEKVVAVNGEKEMKRREEEMERQAEEERLRRTHPTPQNSPVILMRAPPAVDDHSGAEVAVSKAPSPQPTAPKSNSPQPPTQPVQPPTNTKPIQSSSPTTPTKARPPPLIPSPPNPALPSTSYALSSPSRTSATSAGVARDRSPVTTPRTEGSEREQHPSIMGKAAEIVTSAGAFFGLWN